MAVEDRLLAEHIAMFQLMGESLQEATAIANSWLAQAKDASIKAGTDDLPENFGEVLLSIEATDERVRVMLFKARRDGATDSDVRFWWNMPDLERRMIDQGDNLNKMSLYLHLRDNKGRSPEEAARHCRSRHPYFGDIDSEWYGSVEDRLLPYELKFRIISWIQKWATPARKDEMNAMVAEATSFNALVRQQIRLGKL